LKEKIEELFERSLASLHADVGYSIVTGEDNCLILSEETANRLRLPLIRRVVDGEAVRDWEQTHCNAVLWPYHKGGQAIPHDQIASHLNFVWAYRTSLKDRKAFGVPMEKKGLSWWGLREIYSERLMTNLTLAFGELATHNHFVLDRGGSLFHHSAPIIKFGTTTSDEMYLGVLGLLNSSVACFWLRQVCFPKGGSGINCGIKDELWEQRFAFNANNVIRLPVPSELPIVRARQIDALAQEYAHLQPAATCRRRTPEKSDLASAHQKGSSNRHKVIALQEELDWECYRHYALLTDDLCYTGDDLPELTLGQRAFEIVMARQMEKGQLQTAWFERHGSTPITEIPKHWPAAYRKLVENRIKLIETNKEIGLIERPEYKRRWNTESWAEQQQRALKNWLLDRLEDTRNWPGVELQSTARLADRASTDAEFMQVAALFRGRADFDVNVLVAELVGDESVPFLPVLRYKATGLRKRAVWERTWDLQRQEDSGEEIGDIPVPPKYATADFLKADYWRLRGKLDVPQERWVSYPNCSTENDPSLVVGWAGWDHLQQATALIAYYDARKRDGWTANRLTPLLAGLDQLLPWIHQWHPERDKESGTTWGEEYHGLLTTEAHELGLTLDEIRQWTPPATTTRRRARK
jgi:hypothetical protein